MADTEKSRTLSQDLVNRLMSKEKPYNVWYTGKGAVPQLYIKVRPTGLKTWHIAYRLPNVKSVQQPKIAAGSVALKKAREIATEWLGDLAKGLDPKLVRKPGVNAAKEIKTEGKTLKDIIDLYKPYVGDYKKPSAKHTLWHLNAFKIFFNVPVENLTPGAIAEWQTAALGTVSAKTGKTVTASTVIRRLAALKAMLNWAEHMQYIQKVNCKIEKLPNPDNGRIRVLADTERKRLFEALNAEKWKNTYMPPAVKLALYTGIRQGTLRQLRWDDISFEMKTATLRAEIMKNNRNYTIPLNNIVINILSGWENMCVDTGGEKYIFPQPGRLELPINESRLFRDFNELRQEAEIPQDFTWHCFRHTFATDLIKKNVNLRVVQELMTHRKIDQTIRYTHPDPATKSDAVNLLD